MDKVKFQSGLRENLPEPSESLNGLFAVTTDTNEAYLYHMGFADIMPDNFVTNADPKDEVAVRQGILFAHTGR